MGQGGAAGRAFGETGSSPLALTGDDVAFRDNDIGQRHAAFKPRLYRPYLDGCNGVERPVFAPLQALATGNATAQHLNIVKGRPYCLALLREQLFAAHFHMPVTSIRC